MLFESKGTCMQVCCIDLMMRNTSSSMTTSTLNLVSFRPRTLVLLIFPIYINYVRENVRFACSVAAGAWSNLQIN